MNKVYIFFLVLFILCVCGCNQSVYKDEIDIIVSCCKNHDGVYKYTNPMFSKYDIGFIICNDGTRHSGRLVQYNIKIQKQSTP